MGPNPAPERVEVGIVETNDTYRRYKAALIDGTSGMRTAWACARAKDGLAFISQNPPRVVLAGLFLRDMAGTDFVLRIRANWPGVLPILLIPDAQPKLLVETLEVGACAYLPTPCPAEELIRAIWTVHGGGVILARPVAKPITDYFRARGSIRRLLTDREQHVMRLLSEGCLTQEIAAELGVTRETLRTHIRHVLAKLDAHSIVEALAFYLNPKMPLPARRGGGAIDARKLEAPSASNIYPFPVPRRAGNVRTPPRRHAPIQQAHQ